MDESRFPLVVVTFPVSADDVEFGEYLQGLSRLLERRGRMATVFDARQLDAPPATQRARQADWLKTNREQLRKYSCGSVFVSGSPLIRGTMTAILWVAPMPMPHAIVATMQEAETWAIGRLIAEGIAPAKANARG